MKFLKYYKPNRAKSVCVCVFKEKLIKWEVHTLYIHKYCCAVEKDDDEKVGGPKQYGWIKIKLTR